MGSNVQVGIMASMRELRIDWSDWDLPLVTNPLWVGVSTVIFAQTENLVIASSRENQLSTLPFADGRYTPRLQREDRGCHRLFPNDFQRVSNYTSITV